MERALGLAAGLLLLVGLAEPRAATVTTVIGTGEAGLSDAQVANPYGVVVGPDGALYFCDLDNQRIRRLDRATGVTTTIAGNGERGYSGDGGPATAAALDMPHEIQFDGAGHLYIVERDAFDPQGRLLICDIGNHRIRRVDPGTGLIETWAGTGAREPTPDGAPLAGTPLDGPRAMASDPDGSLYLALREGNAIYRIDLAAETIHHVAGTGEQGYTGDGGPAAAATLAGPKGLAFAAGRLYIADTENHVIRMVDTGSGLISTVLGDGTRGDGPEDDPLRCRLARPHGIFHEPGRGLYVGDSEAHRIRLLEP